MLSNLKNILGKNGLVALWRYADVEALTGVIPLRNLDADEDLVNRINKYTACNGWLKTDQTVCHMTEAAIQGILRWTSSGEDHQVIESLCAIQVDPYSEFHSSKEKIFLSGVA